MKHTEKHFGIINSDDLFKIISGYICLKLLLSLILMCVCCPSGVVDMETQRARQTCTYMIKSCICGHHVSKDFCTPIINEVLVCTQENETPHDPYAVAAKKGNLVVGQVPRKTSVVAYCFYGLELLQLL